MLDQQCTGYAQLSSVTGRLATKPQFHYERRILGRAQWKTKRRRDIGKGTKVTLSVVIVSEILRLVKTVNTDVNLSFLCCVGFSHSFSCLLSLNCGRYESSRDMRTRMKECHEGYENISTYFCSGL